MKPFHRKGFEWLIPLTFKEKNRNEPLFRSRHSRTAVSRAICRYFS